MNFRKKGIYFSYTLVYTRAAHKIQVPETKGILA